MSVSQKPLASAVVYRDDEIRAHQRNLSDIVEVSWNHVMPMDSARNIASNSGASSNNDINSKYKIPCRAVHQQV